MAIRTALACVGLGFVLVACGSSEERNAFEEPTTSANGNGAAPGGENPGSLGNGTPPPEPPKQPEECTKMDIVFVVDDSGSMAEEQNNLATNFPKFVQKIESFKTKGGSKLDWRLAVTTTARNIKYNISVPGFGSMPMSEKGDDGAFRTGSGCGSSKKWVEMGDSNAEGTFQCRAKAGTNGSSIEMPLEATKLALEDRVNDGTNAGFLRPDALLALVILTDEDDCSRTDDNFTIADDRCDTMQGTQPVSHYKDVLDTVAKGEGRWATAIIAGDKQCKSSFGDAIEAKRLKEFSSLPGVKSTFSSICDGDLTAALDKALDLFDGACKALPPATVK